MEGSAVTLQAQQKPLTAAKESHPPNLVIPTGAKRSGGICSHPPGATKPHLPRPEPLRRKSHLLSPCHPDRSEAKWRDLQSTPGRNKTTSFAALGHSTGKATPLPLSSRPERSEVEGSAVTLQTQQNPTFSAPAHYAGEATPLPLSSRPERSAAEGSAVCLHALTKPYL